MSTEAGVREVGRRGLLLGGRHRAIIPGDLELCLQGRCKIHVVRWWVWVTKQGIQFHLGFKIYQGRKTQRRRRLAGGMKERDLVGEDPSQD